MLKRVISGCVCALILFATLVLSSFYPLILNISVAIITMMATAEILVLRNEFKFGIISVSSIVFAPLRSLFGSVGRLWKASLYIYIIIALLLSINQFITNRKQEVPKKTVNSICFIFVMTYIIAFALSEIIKIRNFGEKKGIFYVLLAIGIAWSCDVGAYFWGNIFGKNKLCPDLSPSKTIEGAVGGALFSLVFAVSSGLIFENFFGIKNINYLALSFMSIFGAPMAILGDLCFSLIKRSMDIKDFGDIIPGHGGILDRFDSVIFTVPYVYIYLRLVSLF
ncbi:MAG: phosphatidate cytidylyltransferase [Oscillospiraceae bacterium]|nr:phosphatidate cytidylyltransferase [Oscillospiraceae bacterium]